MLRGILKSRRSEKLYCPVADPGEAYPPYLSTKMRPKGPKKNFWETRPPLSQGLNAPPPHPPTPPSLPYLKVWIQKTRKFRVYAPGDYIRSPLDETLTKVKL